MLKSSKQFQKVAVHAFIKKGNKFLVTLRSPVNDYKPNEWDLPGGTVEFGEDIEPALKRELLEETKLKVQISKPIYVCSQTKNERHQFWIVYECKYIKGEVKLNSEEHGEFKWINKKQLNKIKKIYFLDSFYKKYLLK